MTERSENPPSLRSYPPRAVDEPGRGGGVAVFVITTFAVTWLIWLPILIRARSTGIDTMPWTFFLASVGPLCGALTATWWEAGRCGLIRWARRVFSLRYTRTWWIACIAMPLGYFMIGCLAVRATSGQWPDLNGFGQTDKLPGLPWPAVALVWAVSFGVGEEAGWRGWLLPRLSHQISVFWAALIVAGVWIAWHGPAFFFNPTYMSMGAGLLGWMVALMCGSYLLSWLTVGAQWSIVPVVLWHAGFDLLTAADQSAGVFAAAVSTVVMLQGVCSGVILWRRRGPRTARP
ncbi:Abortive infection protein [Mycobacterium adipatum]|uniref:Abortive infection protein n=1 Tax=Mycobacterium adipatum TaxID=1682113 RepID=A0A172UMT5_9MYCO|nr:CPBP family intramembrane glutamic endopeptidase [Mycobacterium adipatum]ANE80381.1 Abortive infection protein [Mycobacterium adipatum]